MPNKSVSFDDELYVKLVELNRIRQEGFSDTIAYLVKKGLEATAKGASKK